MLPVPNVPARLRPWLWTPGAGSDAYVPAHVRYLMIFSPPLAQHRDAEDPKRLTEQLLFYTGEESAVSQAQMVRQVALASALVDFGRAAPAGTSASATGSHPRRVSAASTSRRLLLVEVEPDVWLHACIAVPQYAGRGGKPEHLHWLVDAAAEQQLLDAWAQWRLRYGDPGALLHRDGRAALERTLEHFFSRWVWQWDVEHQHVPLLRASAPRPPPLGMVAETIPALPSAPEPAQLDPPVHWFSEASAGHNSKPVTWLLLRDDEVIFPAMHSDAAETSALDAQDRRQIAMLVLEHVRGLEVARVREETAKPPVRRPPKSHAPATSPGRLVASTAMSAPSSPTLSVADEERQGPGAWLGVDRMWSQVTNLGGQVASSVPSLPRLRRSAEEPAAGDNDNGPAIQVNQQETVATEPERGVSDGQGATEAGAAHSGLKSRESGQPAPSAEQVSSPPKTGQEQGDKGGNDRLFTTSAPFQALHDRLEQALQVDDGAKADEPARSGQEGAASTLPAQPAPEPGTKPAIQQDVSHTHPPSAPQATDERATDARATTGSTPVQQAPDAPQTARSFPSLFAAPSQWYAWMRQDSTEDGAEAQKRAAPPPPADPHDALLDGWGHEDPEPWQREQVHVGGSHTGGLLDKRAAMHPLHVTHTTRGLLTAVFVWEQDVDTTVQEAYLPLVWELLRRVQRVLNDAQRRRDEERGPEAPLRFLHTQRNTALAADRLGTADVEAGAEAPDAPGVEAQLVAAQQLMQRHGVAETLAREEQGRFWVATRAGAADGPSTDPTFLVLAGPQQRRVGVAECDHQLRRLAAQHPEFAL